MLQYGVERCRVKDLTAQLAGICFPVVLAVVIHE